MLLVKNCRSYQFEIGLIFNEIYVRRIDNQEFEVGMLFEEFKIAFLYLSNNRVKWIARTPGHVF